MKTPLRTPNKKLEIETTDVLQDDGNYARFFYTKEQDDKGWQFLSFVDIHDFTIIDEANLSDYVIEAVNSVKPIGDLIKFLSEKELAYLKKRNEVVFGYEFNDGQFKRIGIIVYNENDMETPLRLKQTTIA